MALLPQDVPYSFERLSRQNLCAIPDAREQANAF